MAEAVQNKIPPYARCYLSNALSVDRALQPGFGDTDKRDAEISARQRSKVGKYFCGRDRGLRRKTNRSVVA